MGNWISSTLTQMREGGFQVIVRKFKRLMPLLSQGLSWILIFPFAVSAVFIIRLIRPWVLVRVGVIRSDRIGHFGIDAPMRLSEQALRPDLPRTIDLFCVSSNACNEQWLLMARRELNIYWWVSYLIPINDRIRGGECHHVLPIYSGADFHGTIYQVNTFFKFTPTETKRATDWMKKRGWKENTPFVCVQARDSKYLLSGKNKDWSYHDYRNSDIETYVQTIKKLVAKGYWVVRMGKVANNELSFKHQNVIDYPFVSDQDDLMDIWLSANCEIFISTGSGLDSVADAYLVPTAYVNVIPLALMRAYAHVIWVPKHLIWKSTGQFLSFRECLDHVCLCTEEYERAGIEIKDLSEDEIFDAVDEIERRVAGTWKDTEEELKMHERFWEIFKEWPEFSKHHDWVHPEARVGTRWLKSMGDNFLS